MKINYYFRKMYYSLFILFTYIASIHAIDTKQRNGITFINRGHVTFVTDHHRIFCDFNLRPLLESIYEIQHNIKNMKPSETKHKTDMTYLSQICDELQERITNIVQIDKLTDTLFKSPRKFSNRYKRGLIDVGGTVASYLFGLVTHNELEMESLKINDILTTQENVVNTINKQTSVLKETSIELENLQNSMTEMAKITKNLVSSNHKVEHQLKVLMITSKLNNIFTRITTMDIGIDKLRNNKFAPEIFPIKEV